MGDPSNLVELLNFHGAFHVTLALIICLLLGMFAVVGKILDRKGAVAASVIGAVIAITTDFVWLLILILFLALNHFVTITKFSYKEERGLSEGKKGKRGLDNVLANGFIPSVIAFSSLYLETGVGPVLYLTAVCAVSADTFASELGVLSEKVYMITNFKRVKPGVDGGISVLGQFSAVMGSVILAGTGFILIGFLSPRFLSFSIRPLYFLIPFIAGFISCQLDSYLGATLQRWKYLSNNGVNFLSVTVTTMSVWALFVFDIV